MFLVKFFKFSGNCCQYEETKIVSKFINIKDKYEKTNSYFPSMSIRVY